MAAESKWEKEIVKIVKELSKKEKKDLKERMVKMYEEMGELSAAVLQHLGLKGTKKTPLQVKENILEESVDVFMLTLSLFPLLDYEPDDFLKMLHKKMKKWESKL